MKNIRLISRIPVTLAGIFVLTCVSVHATGMKTTEFEIGQVWTLKSSTLAGGRAVIGRIEMRNRQLAVHISLIDIPIPDCVPGGGRLTTIHHMPFEKDALAASVDQLLASDASPAPEFENGYNYWLAAKGGIYAISVENAVTAIFGCK